MLTLAVDTTQAWGSIALADENGVREEVPLHAPEGFSHVLFDEIDSLLKRQDVRLADVQLFAGASGPGSFTGVRVGLSAIKGLAEVLGKRIVALSSLRILAEFGTSDARATLIDAHRGEIYGALYNGSGKQIVPETVLPFEKFRELLPVGPVEWISQTPIPGLDGPAVLAPRAIARALSLLAIRMAAAGLAEDPAAIEANYVRRSDAEIFFKG